MYICEDCKATFNEKEIVVKTYYDTVEFWGEKTPMAYITYHCPYCNSEEIKEYEED